MPRYYFNVQDDLVPIDDHGTELTDAAAAKIMALRVAGDYIRELGPDFLNKPNWQLEVTDEVARRVVTIKLLVY